MRPFRTAATAFALLACLSAVASAQSAPSARSNAAPRAAAPAAVAPTQVVSGSPLSLMFGALSAEYEKTFSRSTTIGASGTLYNPEGWSYTSAEGKYRFYPNGALRGFSIGGTGGFTRITAKAIEDCEITDDFDLNCTTSNASANAATFGVELDYQWFLGTQKNLVVVTGLGAKKLVFLGDELNGASGTLPTVRIGVGYGF